jgi:hypothetical protein
MSAISAMSAIPSFEETVADDNFGKIDWGEVEKEQLLEEKKESEKKESLVAELISEGMKRRKKCYEKACEIEEQIKKLDKERLELFGKLERSSKRGQTKMVEKYFKMSTKISEQIWPMMNLVSELLDVYYDD